MTTQEAPKTWQAPGPGMWERDEAHQSAPFAGYTMALFDAYFSAGMEEGGARYGLLFQTFDGRWVDGWAYMRPRIVGAPEKPGPLPPKWVFKLLFKLHPALRGRTKAAQAALAEGRWKQDADWWVNEGRASMRARLRSLQSVELRSLNDAALQRHHREVLEVLAEGFRIHFRNALAHWIGVGDWLAKTSEWTGTPPEEALHALEGSSPFSVDALVYLDRIATALKTAPGATDLLTASGDAGERLTRLRASSPAVDTAVGEYLDEHGWRIFTGFDVTDQAVIEMPESVLRSIASRLEKGAESDRGTRYAAELRAKVPAQHVAEYDSLFETARLLYGVRDDDAGMTIHWTMGLSRRLLLETGRRLAERGTIAERDLVFDAAIEEVDALLGGEGTGVSGNELIARAAMRIANAANVPPSRLGEDEGPPPPDDWMPSAVARVNGAMMLAMAVEVPPPLAGDDDAKLVKGLGASAGVDEGRACVVQGPDDFAKLQQGDILVAQFTTTAYNVVLPMLGGVVTDKGGILSHAAIVAREYAIPAVVNTGNGTATIPDGARIRIDGAAGTVEILSPHSQADARPAVGSNVV